MVETDIIALQKALGEDVRKVLSDCQQCEMFWGFDGEEPVLDAIVRMRAHEHDDFDVGIEVIKQVEEIDCEVTIGETIES